MNHRRADRLAEGESVPAGDGFRNLALGVLGFISALRRDGFREATVIAVAIVGIDMLEEGNLAPGNSVQNIGNLLKPALLIPMLIVSRRSEDGAATIPSDQWRKTVVETAGMVTAVVGTCFGIGFALELTVPAMLIAGVLAVIIVARRADMAIGGAER